MSKSLSVIKEMWEYDDGNIYWKKDPSFNKPRKGMLAGGPDSDGYLRVKCQGEQYHIHTIVWALHHNEIWSGIDHINRDHADNRIENLRKATGFQNGTNIKAGASGVVGITRNKYGSFYARCQVNGVRVSTPSRKRLEDAIADRLSMIGGREFESEYIELTKQRMISGDMSKPEELYELLLSELKSEKARYVIPWLRTYMSGKSITDVGGSDGYVIRRLLYDSKTVIDKRVNEQHDGIKYVEELYDVDNCIEKDTILFSEVLHTMANKDIEKILNDCKAKTIIVIENKWDDYLDLRLRMWSNGRCLEKDYISSLLKVEPILVGNHNIWVKDND